MTDAAPSLSLIRYEELKLDDISSFSVLARCYAAWRASSIEGRLPATVDIREIPAETLPYTMLLDYLPKQQDVYVRIAGNYVGERSAFGEQIEGLRGFFNETDAAIVYESLVRIAETKTPSLARRDYVSIEGQRYRYVRLIMPLSADGNSVTGFFKTIEPASLQIE